MIYFDSAATSFLKPDCVIKAVADSFYQIGNAGRGAHAATLAASRLVYDARVKLADMFGASKPEQVVFTANITQALNMVIEGLFADGDHVITTIAEHNSVLRPLFRKEDEGVRLSIIGADEKGNVDIDSVNAMITSNTRAIIVAHASNVTGNVVDIKKIAEMINGRDILLIVDSAQTAGSMKIDIAELGIDILAFTGHKSLLGPQGTGGLVLSDRVVADDRFRIEPLIVGGSGIRSFDRKHPDVYPTALEAGTLNGHGLAGLNAAIDYIESVGIDVISKKETDLGRHFLSGIKDIAKIRLYGDYDADCRMPIVTINIGDMDAAKVCDILWEEYEIAVRAGAHCAPLIHRHFATEDQGAVRFSFSYFNTIEEVDCAIEAIHNIAADYTE